MTEIKTSADYEQGEVALLVMDMQQGLFQRSNPIYRAEALLHTVKGLIDDARRRGMPVFFIQHSNTGSLASGSEAWQLHPEMQPRKTEPVIQKRQANAFEGTNFQERLAARGVKKLIVAGLVTQTCIKATCIGALKMGYEVVLVEDAHSNFSKQAENLIRTWNQQLHVMGVEIRSHQVAFE
jgi:nicotinamidase-related amidase